ncbi:MAG TPA: DinB family protein [Longimicrobiaceae bacterium]|nr:DinB family protein [Longimicrobiaceae bacterium]
MTNPLATPPAPDEYASFYAGYVALAAAGGDVPGLLAGQPAELRRLCEGLDEEGALARYAPGKWSVKEVVGHLADTERVYAYRALRVGRGDATPLAGFDENAYVAAAGSDRRPLAELLDDFQAARAATLALLRGMPEDAWERRGVANEAPVSTRSLAYVAAGHVRHHLELLRERYGLGPGNTPGAAG